MLIWEDLRTKVLYSGDPYEWNGGWRDDRRSWEIMISHKHEITQDLLKEI